MTSDQVSIGWQFLDEGDNEAARWEFEDYISKNAGESSGYVGLGKALARLGDYGDALRAFETAVQLDPRSSETHCGMGSAYSYLGMFAEALEAYKQAIRWDSENSDAQYGLAWVYYQMGDQKKAAFHAGRASELAPGVTRNHLLAARCIGSKDAERTLQHLERASRLAGKQLNGRWRALLIIYRIFAGGMYTVHKVLMGWALIAAVYATSLSAADLQRWLWVATLPFLGVSGYNLVKRRYYRTIWAFGLGLLWLITMYLLFVAGKGG